VGGRVGVSAWANAATGAETMTLSTLLPWLAWLVTAIPWSTCRSDRVGITRPVLGTRYVRFGFGERIPFVPHRCTHRRTILNHALSVEQLEIFAWTENVCFQSFS
jgi:hypothetical protein